MGLNRTPDRFTPRASIHHHLSCLCDWAWWIGVPIQHRASICRVKLTGGSWKLKMQDWISAIFSTRFFDHNAQLFIGDFTGRLPGGRGAITQTDHRVVIVNLRDLIFASEERLRTLKLDDCVRTAGSSSFPPVTKHLIPVPERRVSARSTQADRRSRAPSGETVDRSAARVKPAVPGIHPRP